MNSLKVIQWIAAGSLLLSGVVVAKRAQGCDYNMCLPNQTARSFADAWLTQWNTSIDLGVCSSVGSFTFNGSQYVFANVGTKLDGSHCTGAHGDDACAQTTGLDTLRTPCCSTEDTAQDGQSTVSGACTGNGPGIEWFSRVLHCFP
jgi:hypothetical protein